LTQKPKFSTQKTEFSIRSIRSWASAIDICCGPEKESGKTEAPEAEVGFLKWILGWILHIIDCVDNAALIYLFIKWIRAQIGSYKYK
jgi:hypothetical protein